MDCYYWVWYWRKGQQRFVRIPASNAIEALQEARKTKRYPIADRDIIEIVREPSR